MGMKGNEAMNDRNGKELVVGDAVVIDVVLYLEYIRTHFTTLETGIVNGHGVVTEIHTRWQETIKVQLPHPPTPIPVPIYFVDKL
jgi:hypothetical protein